jgi:hypothetical protein
MFQFLPVGRACVAGAVILAAVLVSVSACMSWRSEPLSPAQLIATKNPPVVQVTRTDSSKVILKDPEIAGDTLYGHPQSSLDETPADRAGIPLAGIQSIATHKSDPTKTTLLVAGIGVATFAALCAADALGCGPEESFLEAVSRTK